MRLRAVTARAMGFRAGQVTVRKRRQAPAPSTALNLIWNFNSFALVYVLTSGGPGGRTRLPMLFAYEEAFRYGQFGYAAAMGCVMVAVISIALAVFLAGRLRGGDEA